MGGGGIGSFSKITLKQTQTHGDKNQPQTVKYTRILSTQMVFKRYRSCAHSNTCIHHWYAFSQISNGRGLGEYSLPTAVHVTQQQSSIPPPSSPHPCIIVAIAAYPAVTTRVWFVHTDLTLVHTIRFTYTSTSSRHSGGGGRVTSLLRRCQVLVSLLL